MSIVMDIYNRMIRAPKKAIGVHLGVSGFHAYHADCALIHGHGREIDKARMAEVLRLAVFRTAEFGGFDLIFDDVPNPYRPDPRRVAA